MFKTRQNAVYNLRLPYMLTTRSSSLRTACLMLVILVLWCHGLSWAGDWDASEQQLAEKIVAVTGPGVTAIGIENRSSLTQTDAEAIRHGLIDRLSALGL